MEGGSGVTRRVFDDIHSWDIQGDQIEGESGVTSSIIDELHSLDIQGGQMEGESMVLLEVLLINFIIWLSKEINWKVKVV